MGVLEEELDALQRGRAFADLSSYRKVTVSGAEAGGWLNDLVTAGVASLPSGHARRSLLLTPTGRIRADFTVARVGDEFQLLQDERQPAAIADLLSPYVLSSDVEIQDVTAERALVAIPGAGGEALGRPGTRPSVLGSGIDLIADSGEPARRLTKMLTKELLVEVSAEALEIWRIRRGIPRFPVDLTEESIPAEGGLEDLIDLTKGCFLGQESVAKVRNLGHPTRVVAHLQASGPIHPGDAVLSASRPAGRVTSAAPGAEPGSTTVLAGIRWDAAEGPLTSANGEPLERRS